MYCNTAKKYIYKQLNCKHVLLVNVVILNYISYLHIKNYNKNYEYIVYVILKDMSSLTPVRYSHVNFWFVSYLEKPWYAMLRCKSVCPVL